MKKTDKMLKHTLRQVRRRQMRLLRHLQHLERLLVIRPAEIHNHFEAGSTAQVYNGRAASMSQPTQNHEDTKEALPTTAVLTESVAQVRQYLWAESAMAVVFCACRDCYGYPDNMSRFEREFGCTEGLLSGTLRNNPYMRLPVGRWQQAGAKPRALRLLEAYREAVENGGK